MKITKKKLTNEEVDTECENKKSEKKNKTKK